MKIDNDTLFWVFGVELGMIDCSIRSIDELREQVVNNYTEEEIENIVNNI